MTIRSLPTYFVFLFAAFMLWHHVPVTGHHETPASADTGQVSVDCGMAPNSRWSKSAVQTVKIQPLLRAEIPGITSTSIIKFEDLALPALQATAPLLKSHHLSELIRI
jgi:hypothetical protein